MKLHFDPNQQYQHDAINAIVRVFEGQPLNHGDFSFTIDNRNIIMLNWDPVQSAEGHTPTAVFPATAAPSHQA